VEGFALLITKKKIVLVFNVNKRKRNPFYEPFYFLRGSYFLSLFTHYWGWRGDTLPFFKVESQHEKINTERKEK
jgi:hypothetical protein